MEILRCAACGLIYLWPRPSDLELEAYYAGDYRDEYGDAPVERRYISDTDEARTRVRRLLPLLGGARRLLEVGSGSGAFLDAVRPYVTELMGVEPDSRSQEWIRGKLGLPVRSTISDLDLSAGGFDCVVLFHILEHIVDPVTFLEDLRELLKPGGHVVVEVPNVDDALISLYRIDSYRSFYFQKAHLHYFSMATLTSVFEQARLGVAITGIQRYDLSNHLRWMLTGEPGGQGYYNEVLTPSVHAAYADALVRADRSDTLWAVGTASTV